MPEYNLRQSLRRILRLAALICLLGTSTGCAPKDITPSAVNAVMRAPIAGRTVSSAYLRIVNPGNSALTLESVHSDQVGAIEIHEHQNVDGQMRMRRVPTVAVPANGSLSFEPGGLHLMLFRLALTGQPLVLELRFSDGTIIQTTAVIESL